MARSAVLVTGICGRLGHRVVRALHRERPVIGLDRRPSSDLPQDVEHIQADLMRSATRQLIRGPELGAIVHLGITHDPHVPSAERHTRNLLSLEKLYRMAEDFEIPKLVVLSTANAYGPRAGNAQFLTEDAPLLGSGRSVELRTLVELDMLAQSFALRSSKCKVVVLRPANILGLVKNAASNYLRLPVVPTLLGFDPMVQAVHEDDVVRAISLALKADVSGVFNIAGPPPIHLSRALSLLERRTVAVPHTVAQAALGSLFAARVTRFESTELDFIRYVCMIDDSRARRLLGYEPACDLKETLLAVDRERWVG